MDDWKKVLQEEPRERAAAAPKKARRTGRLLAWLFGISTLALLLVWLGTAVARVYFSDRIYKGVSVLNIDVGGMTKAEAEAALSAYSVNFYSGKQIILEYGETRLVLAARDISLALDANTAAETAYAYGRSGSFFTRMRQSALPPAGPIPSVGATYNRAQVEAKVAEFAALVNVPYKNFSYKIDNQGLTVYAGQTGVHVNQSALLAEVTAMLDEGRFGAVAAAPDIMPSDPPDWGPLCASFYEEPQDATVEKSGRRGFRIVPGKAGKDIDQALLARDMETLGFTEKLYPFIITEPAVSAADLAAVLFRDTLSESITTLNPAETNRTANVRLSAEAVNEIILLPGEEFSFNKIVGERTASRGYRSAKVFAQGEVVDDIGGGICQVSSALYQATLLADLEVTERRTHAYAVSYVPLGQDATVQWGYLDYRFVNNGKYPVRILTALDGGTLTVRFVGTKEDPNKIVTLESVKTDTYAFETQRVANTGLAKGFTRDVQRGQDGYRSETYKVTYDGETFIQKDRVNVSVYKSQPHIIEYGP